MHEHSKQATDIEEKGWKIAQDENASQNYFLLSTFVESLIYLEMAIIDYIIA